MSTADYIVLPIPLLLRTQALNSVTFTLPPLDGSLTIPEIYDFHYVHSPKHPLFAYGDGAGSVREVLWADAVRAMHQAGRIVQSRLGQAGETKARPVIAVLAMSDTITFWAVLTGIVRANCVPFAISPRNSPAAIAHLLAAKDVSHVLVGVETYLQNLIGASLDLMSSRARIPGTSAMPVYEDLYYVEEEGRTFVPLPVVRPALSEEALILHTSGSTDFPKPIPWSHHGILQLAAQIFSADCDLTGKRWSYHSVPMFHAMGMGSLAWAMACGMTVTVFGPARSAVVPSPESVIKALADTNSELALCVPSFIETWSTNPEHVEVLRKLQGVIIGGGPLNKEVGDNLTRQGVAVILIHGCTELGVPWAMRTSGVTFDWEYFEISPRTKMLIEADQNGMTEFIIEPNPMFCPMVLNAKRGQLDVFASKDLLVPHPTKRGFWKIYGRTDDQIMHSTGEKTNPGPLEALMNRDPIVASSVMFGRGKFNAGILVAPVQEHAIDPTDSKKLEEFRKKIWPTVERMNDFAPQHSRIFKEMILVASPSKPFTYTIKRTLRRQAVISDYSDEINDLYVAVAETAQTGVAPPASWSEIDTLGFIRSVVTKMVQKPLGDSDDLFQHGCDSVQSTWIRNSLLQALSASTTSNIRAISPNIVYDHPSISSLVAFASRFALSESQGELGSENRVAEMLAMVKSYSQTFPKHHRSVSIPKKDVIVVTGTTGSLGTALLAAVVALADVVHVFALNRKDFGGASLAVRQSTSLQRQGLDPAIASSAKVTLLEADLSALNLGLSFDVFDSVRSSVTHIIHSAWPVDFNLTLRSFEPQVKGVRNLIDLALASPHDHPPRLLFTSSVGVFRNVDSTEPIKEIPVGPEVAAGTGYSESKWVSERLLEIAASETPLIPTIIRVGQICGGPNGFWSEKEWLPALIRSSLHLKCLPSSKQAISWVPSAVTAKVIAEMRQSSALVVHLNHPRPVLWSSLFESFSSTLGIPLVSYAEWLSRLEKEAQAISGLSAEAEAAAIQSNPALRLISFYRRASMNGGSSMEAMGTQILSLEDAKKASVTMRDENLKQLGSENVKRWLAYWRSTGFLSK